MTAASAIRSGLKTRLETISGVTAYAKLPTSIDVPAATVRRRQTDYDLVMARGADAFTFVITLYVQFVEQQDSQDALDAYLDTTGASSVKAAIEGDGTLGGIVDITRVVSAGEDYVADYNGLPYLAVDFVTEVIG